VWGARYTLGARYLSKNTVINFMNFFHDMYCNLTRTVSGRGSVPVFRLTKRCYVSYVMPIYILRWKKSKLMNKTYLTNNLKTVCANFTKHQMHETLYWVLWIYCCTRLCALRALKDNQFTHPCLKEGARLHHGF
jgi:hypothetical protein